MGGLGSAWGRQFDVEVAVMTAQGVAGVAQGGVGLAGGQDFFDLAHGVNPQGGGQVRLVSYAFRSYPM